MMTKCLSAMVAALIAQTFLPEPGLYQVQGSGPPDRWVILYAGAPSKATTYPRYTSAEDLRFVSAVDSSGRPTQWLTTGAIFAAIYGASGRSFATWSAGKWPALGPDWEAYADSLMAPDGILARLDSAVAQVAAVVGPRHAPYKVVIMIPYPDSSLGKLSYRGWS